MVSKTMKYFYLNHLIMNHNWSAVTTDLGKTRSLIRAALNERCLERYILTWLTDKKGLEARFESWSLLRDSEASNLLPSLAAG